MSFEEIEMVDGGARVIDAAPRHVKYIGIAATGAMVGAAGGPIGALGGATSAIALAFLGGV